MIGADFTPSEETRANQRVKVLTALRSGPQKTASLVRLGVLAPAKRIQELRNAGHNISTLREGAIGVYVLRESSEE